MSICPCKITSVQSVKGQNSNGRELLPRNGQSGEAPKTVHVCVTLATKTCKTPPKKPLDAGSQNQEDDWLGGQTPPSAFATRGIPRGALKGECVEMFISQILPSFWTHRGWSSWALDFAHWVTWKHFPGPLPESSRAGMELSELWKEGKGGG